MFCSLDDLGRGLHIGGWENHSLHGLVLVHGWILVVSASTDIELEQVAFLAIVLVRVLECGGVETLYEVVVFKPTK